MEFKVGKNPCPSKKCSSSDGFHFYGEGLGGHCFSCGHNILSDERRAELGLDELYSEEEVSTMEYITPEEVTQLKGYTSVKGHGVRGISDDTYKWYGVRTKCDETTGEPVAQYYPYFEEDKGVTGFKIRDLPKKFSTIGKIGQMSELFGQFRYRNSNSKTVIICAGEIDAMSARDILVAYNRAKNSDYEETPVVSPTTGEGGCIKQLKNHYTWLNRFDKIILIFDNDAAGQEATEKAVKALPKGKVYTTSFNAKDVNELVKEGRDKEFLTAFFKAKLYTPDGILSSSDLMSKIKEAAKVAKVPLPEFMHKLQEMMAGGIPLGVIVNLGSASGTGKSTIVDELCYYWFFNSPHMVGVLSLESDAAQYGTKVLSRHMGRKIDLIKDMDEKIAYLETDEVREASEELFFKEDGSPRWFVIEDRDGGLDSIKELIMNLIITCECKVIIIDPLQDMLDGLSNEEQSVFLRWMKGLLKSHNVTFININHVRKSSGGKQANSTGADIFEEDFQGSSSIFKSGACNLLFTRNKEAEDDFERNVTKMKASKIRWTGITGVGGEYYYHNATHTMHDKDDWISNNPTAF